MEHIVTSHIPIQTSLMERVIQYLKDRIEGFDDNYPCIKENCNLFQVHKWIQFFVSMYDNMIINNNHFELEEEVNII